MILASSDRWVVVAKPSGMAVHRSKEHPGDTAFLVQTARDLVGRHVWPVHRLDRGTSGAVWLAYDPSDLAAYQAALAVGQKRYVALVRGASLPPGPFDITTPMTDSGGVVREASTTARVLASCEDPRCSLVLAEPRTGRWHQVRRHLRDRHHPVIGDGPHGDSRVNRWWREQRGLGRLALHLLELRVPEAGIDVVCPIPDDLGDVLRALWPELRELG
jgi:tRNA pseudouridine65 synthase